jgi:hypothetical protein
VKRKFAALILTHGRPDRVFTYDSLKKHGYTGDVFFVIDNLDKTAEDYVKRFGKDRVIMFDKPAIAKTFDQADNFNDFRAIIYARNASFEIAKKLGLDVFVQLDDDYTSFQYRFDQDLKYAPKALHNLDRVFTAIVEFLFSSGASSVAMAQGGDFIGGQWGSFGQGVTLFRKAMNSFFCRVDKPFTFVGKINEDVNAYTHLASKGLLLFTINQVNLNQMTTQANSGGMTDLYLDSGTYVKSFYTVMLQPSSVKIGVIRDHRTRIHHSVRWRNTVPKIVAEEFKKQ